MTKNEQKVINFMVETPQLDFLAKEVEKGAKISKAGANLALRALAKKDLLKKEERGKVYFYSVKLEDARIKEIKRLNNVTKLAPLVEKLKSYSIGIVLFGSAARGENFSDSDFDLFILSTNPRKVRELTDKCFLKNRLQVIVKTPIEAVSFNKKNPILSKEIGKGIALWKQVGMI